MKKAFILLLVLFGHTAIAQSVLTLDSSQKRSFRGLSVVSDKIVWVSGSQGTVGRSTDGGQTWSWQTVKGFEHIDFRDIEAFDKNTAIIMGVASPAYILKTTDAGENWKVVYENRDTSMFLDAMEFWNDMSGIVIGDPIGGRFFIGRTFDGGDSWQTIPDMNKPEADAGEACFAASGTNIRALGRGEAVFVTGGMTSNFFKRDQRINLPLNQGSATAGANTLAVGGKKGKVMVVAGGDFSYPNETKGNCAFSVDGGQTWLVPETLPGGYRSGVEYISKKSWITCGLNGVDISDDNGLNWKNISDLSFHVVRKAKKGKSVFLAGANGRIGKLVRK